MFNGLRIWVLSFKCTVEVYLKFNVLSGFRCLKKGSMQPLISVISRVLQFWALKVDPVLNPKL